MPNKKPSRPKKTKHRKVPTEYAPKVKIPLSFDAAVSGLLAVKPEPKTSKPDGK